MNMLITGGTGSLGALLVKKYTGLGHNVTVLSRDAHKQALLAAEVPCRMLLGDICDRRTVARAVRGQDVVIHAVLSVARLIPKNTCASTHLAPR
jgi:uncharacterized protein YbjT (DUF2867 family)